jgi:hypothetical protein
MLMQGTVTQPVADALIVETRTTGARQELFQGIFPAYMRLAFPQSTLVELCSTIRPDRFIVDIQLRGKQSGIVLIWRFGGFTSGAGTFSGIIDGVLEWYVPEFFPIMFDEEMEISLDSTVSGCVLTVDYTMYYAIIQSDELTMVKTIADY